MSEVRWHGQMLRDRQRVQALGRAIGAAVRPGDTVLDLVFEYYVNVRAETEPELPVVILGGLLALTGLVARAVWPPRRAFVALQSQDAATLCRLFVGRGQVRQTWVLNVISVLREGEHG